MSSSIRLFLAALNATTIELDSSHVSLVSHPKEIAELILLAAGYKQSHVSAGAKADGVNGGPSG
jgi:hypothetical protein